MPPHYLTTKIHLPPGPPAPSLIREFFRLAFEEYRWFRPMRYARAFLDKRLDPDRVDYDALMAYYEEFQNMTVAARTDRDFFLLSPSKGSDPPYTGKIVWETSIKEASKLAWRAAHQRQVVELMRLFDSPLAQTGEEDDIERKTSYFEPNPDGFGSTLKITVRGYGEGLAGLFWRNFFGPPFAQMFGERLHTLPAESKQELGEGLVLVQPYALPTEAGTAEGIERERQLIAHLGPECFYDHERHLKPSRCPRLGA